MDLTGGGWRRGTEWFNRTEYAWKTNGQKRKLRTFSSRTGVDKWFPAGRDYYDHNRQKFIINVPCLGYIPPHKANGTRDGKDTILGNLRAALLQTQQQSAPMPKELQTTIRCCDLPFMGNSRASGLLH